MGSDAPTAADYAWSAAQSAQASANQNARTLEQLANQVESLRRRATEYDDGTPRLTKRELTKMLTERLDELDSKVQLNIAQVDECMKAIRALAEQVGELKRARAADLKAREDELRSEIGYDCPDCADPTMGPPIPDPNGPLLHFHRPASTEDVVDADVPASS